MRGCNSPAASELKTPFGTFVPPNISPDPTDGIGAWSVEDFANAMLRGVSPEGEHLYPAFPYTSYARMKPQDVADLYAFMKTLPAVAGEAPTIGWAFPSTSAAGSACGSCSISSDEPVVDLPGRRAGSGAARPLPGRRARPLRRMPHAARHAGGAEKAHWLAGAAAAEGDGIVPNITSGEGGIGIGPQATSPTISKPALRRISIRSAAPWSRCRRTWQSCRRKTATAIAAYLKAVPPHPNGYPARQPAAN